MQRHRKPISGTHGFSVQKQGFLDGFLGGEFRVTFRVHDHSRNEVQKLETPMRTPLLTTSEKMANLQTPGLRPGLHSVAAPRLNRGTKGMPSVSNYFSGRDVNCL